MEMIEEAYCSFEVAKLLKEKGFKEFTLKGYDITGEELDRITPFISWNEDPLVKQGFPNFNTFAKPTHQMAMAWLREEKNILIVIEPHAYDYVNEKNESYSCSLWVGDNYYEYLNSRYYPSYEETVEAALKYVLKNLI